MLPLASKLESHRGRLLQSEFTRQENFENYVKKLNSGFTDN